MPDNDTSTDTDPIKRTESGKYDYGNTLPWAPGWRIEIHPGDDLWMRGARFGTTKGMTKDGLVKVRMDHPAVKGIRYFLPIDIRPA